MKKLLNKICFEYIFLLLIVIEAILLLCTMSVAAVLPLLAISLFFAWKINRVRGICCVAGIVITAIIFHMRMMPRADSLRNVLNSQPIYGKIRFEIIDPLRCSVKNIGNGATAMIRICSITDTAGTVYHGGGKFMLFSRNVLDGTAFYGDVFELTGALRFAEEETVWSIDDGMEISDFRFGNFQNYMKLHGIDGIISPDRETIPVKISSRNSFFRKILQMRDRTLAYITEGMESERNKNVIGAMFFGLKGALAPEAKENFIKSGTIHLFSVSGLHIGILFAILLPWLTFLPVRWRYFCASLLLIPFLATTGANTPALRAFLMILVFSLLRVFYFYVPPYRILALGCAFFLIIRPDYLHDAGFLYSFGITGILLAIGAGYKQWSHIRNADLSLMAVNRKNPERLKNNSRFISGSLCALCSTCGAFAGGSIISLFTFGSLYLSAVWINFFVLFYCAWLIYLFIGKILLTPVFKLGEWCAVVFEKSFDFMHCIIESGAEYPCQLNVGQISLAGAFVFYVALIALLCVRNRKIFVPAALIVVMFYPFNMLCTRLQKPELLSIREPSENKTAFVLAYPGCNYAWCFNIQSAKESEIARKFLAGKGLNHVNLWVLSGTAKNRLHALETADKNIRIGKVLHITRSPFKNSAILPENVVYQNVVAPLNNWRQNEKTTTFFTQKSKIGFEYFDPRAILPLCVVFDAETNMLNIRQGDKQIRRELPNSNIMEYTLYEL